FHAFSMKPQKDHSTGNSGSSAAGHISEAVNEGLVNGYNFTNTFKMSKPSPFYTFFKERNGPKGYDYSRPNLND
ncbi:hypothetical protein KW505_21535, partial [Vibrio fluvialis]|nr:hypothetical protein [Vibrio fluvialis]